MIKSQPFVVASFVLLCAPALHAAEPAGAIEGVVRDGGKPVAGAVVAAIGRGAGDGETAARARSDAGGHFRLSGLAANTYGVTATAPGHTGGLALDVKVDAAVAHADVALGGAGLELRGELVDGASGKPIAAATLWCARISDVEGDAFVSDVQDGHFAVRLPVAGYTVVAVAPGHSPVYHAVPPGSTTPGPFVMRAERSWPAGPAPREVVDWMRAHAVALSSVEAGRGFADLAPLAGAIGDARVIGLGEATHATREFFQLKHRLLEWLVAERGFTLFGIEATMPECEALNAYVLTGKGDPEKLLTGIYFWIWNTQEVLALVRWMRHWNEDPHHARVKLYGFDMQFPQRAARLALEYVARVDAAEAARLGPSLAALVNPIDSTDLFVASPADKRAAGAAVAGLVRRFDEARPAWTARTSEAEWALARQHARLVEQFCVMASAADGLSTERDKAMAENVDWVLAHEPNAKMVLWAHNLHIGAGHPHGLTTMGGELRRRWGKQYVNLAFAFDRGGFRAIDPDREDQIQSFDLPPSPPGSLDHTLAETGLPHLILDLRARPSAGIVGDWFAAMHKHRDYGAIFSAKWPTAQGEDFIVPRQFDLIAFVAATSPSRSLWPAPEPRAAPPSEPRNLGFEQLDKGKPRDWTVSNHAEALGWSVTTSTEQPFAGKRCLLIRSLPARAGEMAAQVSQIVNVERYRGKRVRLSAAVRTRLASGNARLFLDSVVWTFPPQGAVDRMRAHPITSPGWTRQSVEMDVPPATGSAAVHPTLTIGAALWGQGEACFDDFKLEIVR